MSLLKTVAVYGLDALYHHTVGGKSGAHTSMNQPPGQEHVYWDTNNELNPELKRSIDS